MAKFRKTTATPSSTDGIVGPVRFARQQSELASLRAGDVALVELPDLDARQAQELIAAQVSAVLNTAASSTGRMPNQGPKALAHAGITLVDVSGEGIWTRLRNGDVIEVSQGKVLLDGSLVASGIEQDTEIVASSLRVAESGLATRLDSMAANATDHIHREQAMLLDGAKIPRLRTKVRRRPVVVVAKGYDAVSDLKSLKRYIAQNDPVLIAAGNGADVLLEQGYTPHLLVGNLDNMTDKAIRQCGEVVVTTSTGRVSTPERLERHGKEITTFASTGNDEDLAILLADTNEASVIIQVGAPPTLTDFLEQAPSESARLFVARLRAGSKIVDAKSVGELSSRPMALWPVLLLLLAGLLAVAVAISVTPTGQDWFDQLGDSISNLGSSIGGLFS